MSNKLLKKGSLFKFVFQVSKLSDTWFSIELRESKEIKIHFIKNGIWIFHKNMQEKELHYGKDLFNWDFKDRADRKEC